MSTTRKLTRQNMVDIDLVFKHKTSMIEIQPITEFAKENKPELTTGKKSALTYRKRGKSYTNPNSVINLAKLKLQKKSAMKEKESQGVRSPTKKKSTMKSSTKQSMKIK